MIESGVNLSEPDLAYGFCPQCGTPLRGFFAKMDDDAAMGVVCPNRRCPEEP